LENLLAHARRRLVRAALVQVALGGVAGLLLGLVLFAVNLVSSAAKNHQVVPRGL